MFPRSQKAPVKGPKTSPRGNFRGHRKEGDVPEVRERTAAEKPQTTRGRSFRCHRANDWRDRELLLGEASEVIEMTERTTVKGSKTSLFGNFSRSRDGSLHRVVHSVTSETFPRSSVGFLQSRPFCDRRKFSEE